MEPEENVDEILLRKQAAEHLWKIGNFLSSSCASASRFYIFNVEKKLREVPDLLKNNVKMSHLYCRHCGSLWSSENCRIRIQNRHAINRHMKKLLNLEANQPWKLNNRQKKKLRKFRESTNKIVYSCFSCKKKTVFPGSKKSDIKYRSLSQISSSTPNSKIKLKRGNLNAGLFIPSPISIDSNERNNLKESQLSKNIPELETPLRNRSGTQSESGSPVTSEITCNISSTFCTEDEGDSPKNQVISPTVKFTSELTASSAQKQSASKKRRKTLLAQILNQEQKKKKSSLSSFLVSL